jgi:hypothetical protein
MATGVILSGSDFASGSLADAPWNASTKDIAFFTGGITGSAQLNSSLSSPITNAGSYSRLFVHQNDSPNRPYGFYLVSSSIDSGIYSGPYSVSKAYSVRAWIRKESGGNVRDSMIGIILRNKFDGVTNTISDSAENYNVVPGGYTLQYSSRAAGTAPGDGSAYLFLQIRDPYSSPLSFGQTTIRCSGSGASDSYALDTWHRVRIDLIPLLGIGDQINVYTSSAGDVASGNEVWEEVASKFVNNTDSGYVDPADSDVAMGFYTYSQANSGQDAFIDLFEIAVEDI